MKATKKISSPVKETSATDELDIDSLLKIEHQETGEDKIELLKKR